MIRVWLILLVSMWVAEGSLGTCKEFIRGLVKLVQMNAVEPFKHEQKDRAAIDLIQRNSIQNFLPLDSISKNQKVLEGAYPVQPDSNSKWVLREESAQCPTIDSLQGVLLDHCI